MILLIAGGMPWWPAPPPRREAGLNVLLVTIDTLRADAVGAYGGRLARTPWMDRLAASGVRFDTARAHNVVTLPSHANMLSGRHPFDHGVRDNAGFRFPDGQATLATLLKARGYQTAAFVSAFPLDSRFGLDRGFDLYDDHFAAAGGRPAFLIQERRAPDTVRLARDWIAARGEGPWFCWVHLYEPHYPYDPPEGFASGDPYHGEVAAVDAALAPLLEPIVAAGGEGRTLVVLTSDHGESLGEHGEATHGIFAYEAALRVPLILFQPRLWEPRVVGTPARHVDLLPTVLDALAVPVPEGLAGRSLLSLAAGRALDAVPTYFEALSGALNRGWAPLYGVVRGDSKFIDLPAPELYDLGDDPRESRNLSGMEPKRREELRTLLASMRASDRGPRPQPETSETRERLTSLGYLSGRAAAPAEYTEADDPKRLIELDTMLQEVVGYYLDGRLDAAATRARQLIARRPSMPLSHLYLAQIERARGNLPGALQALREASVLDPDDTRTLALLGTYMTEAGRPEEAVELLETRATAGDADADLVSACAAALARAGRRREALAMLDRTHTLDPDDAGLLVQRGTIHLMDGNRRGARESFEAALAINPGIARAHSSLGVVAAEEDRPADAVRHWRTAVDLDRGELDNLLALGMFHRRAGRERAARLYLEFFVAAAPPERYRMQIETINGWLGRGR